MVKAAAMTALALVLHKDSIEEGTWEQATCKLGPGLGLFDPERSATWCYAATLHSFSATTIASNLAEARLNVEASQTSLALNIASSQRLIADVAGSASSKSCPILSLHLKRHAEAYLHDERKSEVERLRLWALSRPFSFAWLQTYHGNLNTAFDGLDFAVALSKYLNISPPLAPPPRCLCSTPIDSDGMMEHLATCPHLGGVTHRHDAVRDLFAELLLATNQVFQAEVVGMLPDQRRIDILLYKQPRALALDVNIRSTATYGYQDATIRGDAFKERKYSDDCDRAGLDFKPLTFDDLAGASPVAEEFFDLCVHRIMPDPFVHVCGLLPIAPKVYWQQLLSCAIWRATAYAKSTLAHVSLKSSVAHGPVGLGH